MRHARAVSILLLVLALWDTALAGVSWFAPDALCRSVHGAACVDPQGLVPRTGAIWAAFALIQFAAFLRWKRRPLWLVLVAGARLGELVADWVYLIAAESVVGMARIGLLLSPVGNLLICLWLLHIYGKASPPPAAGREAAGPPP